MARRSNKTVEALAHTLETAKAKLHDAKDHSAALADQLNRLRSVVDTTLQPHQRTPEIAAELTATEHLLAVYYSGPTKKADES